MSESRTTRGLLAGTVALLLVFFAVNTPLECQSTAQHPLGWITLGTEGGPVPNPTRSQPANVLLVGGTPWIVDCGDGAMERFAQAGFAPYQVDTVFLSHLHADHIAGLQGLIALHWFQGVGNEAGSGTPVTIYGPPGTDRLVAGVVQSLDPTEWIARAELPGKWTPAESVKVVIVKGGADLMVRGVRVRAVQNSHFDVPPGHPQDNGTQSLSYRFDFEGYGVGYTGDTGPSDAVAALERHVNLLVSEVILPEGADGSPQPQVTPWAQLPPAEQMVNLGPRYTAYHFEYQHLSPEDAAKLAAAAGAQHLVFTHLVIAGPTDSVAPELIRAARPFFKGEISVAHDLERF